MTFLEVLQKIHNNEATAFVRDFSTRHADVTRNGAYERIISSSDYSNITTDDIFATDWEIYKQGMPVETSLNI